MPSNQTTLRDLRAKLYSELLAARANAFSQKSKLALGLARAIDLADAAIAAACAEHRAGGMAKAIENMCNAMKARNDAEVAKDRAYQERDRLVCALSKVFPSWLARHPDDDTEWDDDWRWIVFIQLPTGQASWHIHDSEHSWFRHLTMGGDAWDGHTTEEKYRRLEALKVAEQPAPETRTEDAS